NCGVNQRGQHHPSWRHLHYLLLWYNAMIFLAIVSNTKTVPAGSELGKLGLITYTQFDFQDRSPEAGSTRSIMSHGEDHVTHRQTRNDACIPVLMSHLTSAAQRCAGGIQASAASPVWTKSFRLASQ